MGLGLQHPAGRYRPRGCAFSAPACSCNKDTEQRLIRGWEVILPGYGGTSALARGASRAAPWVHGPSQSSITHWGWGFHTLLGSIDAGDLRFRPRVVLVVEIGNSLQYAEGNLSSRKAGGPRRGPEGKISPHPASMGPSQSAITRWGLGFYILRGVIDAKDLRFSSRVVVCVEMWKDF